MEQKFVKFEDAHEQLGITAERLTQLRESGQLRAYRDGASWKFRTDEISKLVDEGLPEPAPPSDIGLTAPEDLVEAEPLHDPVGDDDLQLAGDDASSSGGGSGIDLDELDDTVTAGTSDFSLDLGDEGSDPSDSILLSDEELGESAPTPPSTIIGKSELQGEGSDLDLELSLDDGIGGPSSDVKLALGGSDVLSSGVAGSLDSEKDPDGGSAFDDLEELELDLAAESGSIVGVDSGESTAKQGGIAQAQAEAPSPKEGPSSDLDLATDEDDFVLAESGGSDITLDSGDSGINLDPSDSGLALDEMPLDVSGSAILSSLSLDSEEPEQDISLVPDDDVAQLQTDEGFDLTPMDDAANAEGDSSSQVIALDAVIEEVDEEAGGILDEDAFAEADEGAVVLSEDYSDAADGALGVATYPSASRAETEYSLMNIIGLGCCVLMLFLGVVAMLDMARNIWSWNETFALNSWLLDSLLGLFGLNP